MIQGDGIHITPKQIYHYNTKKQLKKRPRDEGEEENEQVVEAMEEETSFTKKRKTTNDARSQAYIIQSLKYELLQSEAALYAANIKIKTLENSWNKTQNELHETRKTLSAMESDVQDINTFKSRISELEKRLKEAEDSEKKNQAIQEDMKRKMKDDGQKATSREAIFKENARKNLQRQSEKNKRDLEKQDLKFKKYEGKFSLETSKNIKAMNKHKQKIKILESQISTMKAKIKELNLKERDFRANIERQENVISSLEIDKERLDEVHKESLASTEKRCETKLENQKKNAKAKIHLLESDLQMIVQTNPGRPSRSNGYQRSDAEDHTQKSIQAPVQKKTG